MSEAAISWSIFGIVVFSLLFLDLKVLNKKAHEIKVKEALLISAFWIGLALLFNLGIYFWEGQGKAVEFLTGYLLEKSLSVDNLFIFLIIFSYFKVPAEYQHKVLFWGIIGAIIMRFIFIFAGIALVNKFHWLMYVFGAFLVFVGVKLALHKDKNLNPGDNIVFKLFKRYLPFSSEYSGDSFFARIDGKLVATPLFLVLLVIETTDVVFAVDSIPAIFAITLDPFIVFTSNIFAILGLRALYFALAGIMGMFRYLAYGLSVILVFIGVKMLVAGVFKVPTLYALGFITGILALSVVLSLLFPKKEENPGVPN